MASPSWYERLSAQDRSFLVFEGAHTHMHVGGTSIYELAPLATPEGGIDIDRIRDFVAAHLHLMPRYRQRLAYVPGTDYPVWVDDDRFSINYHVRHSSLPRPGDERQLKRLTGRVMSQQLDRRRPLWEMWFVEGLHGDRCAMIMKSHHCMIDGVSGLDLMSVLMRPTPETTLEHPRRWGPRRIPTPAELLRDDLRRQAALPLDIARGAGTALRAPVQTASRFAESLTGAWHALRTGLQPPSDTPINGPIGPYRRCDWTSVDLNDAKAVKNRLGGTINDVIIASVTGGLHRFFQRRRVSLSGLSFRATVPVNIRTAADRHVMGNRVSAWLMELPLQERHPVKRLRRITEATAQLKQSHQASGIDLLSELAAVFDPVFTLSLRMASLMHPYNLIITNVVGTPFPLYFFGARIIEGYPIVPLFENQGLAVGSFSNAGKLFWGFNADWDLLPDLHDFVEAVTRSFRELHDAAQGVYAVRQGKRRPHAAPRRTRSRGA